MVDFGQSWGTPNGQDLSMPSYMATGNRVVAEALLRRFVTTRGTLIDDPNYGFNIYDLISDDLTLQDIQSFQQQLANEAVKDERVFSANFTLTIIGEAPDVLVTITGTATTANGPFKFVLAASATSVQLLLVSP